MTNIIQERRPSAITGIEPELITPEQTARLIGISEAHVYGLQRRGKLGPKAVRLGKSVRWRRSEILNWISAGCPNREAWQLLNTSNQNQA